MNLLERHWYAPRLTWLTALLLPLAWLFGLFSALRRWYLRRVTAVKPPVPVVVVGNINIGGVGKSPLVAAIVSSLCAQGFRPGVISRGYGGKGPYPLVIGDTTAVTASGDEPRMLYEVLGCPFVVDPVRPRALTTLVTEFPEVDVVVSDDGLQHYRLPRSLEIVVADGARGFGNGQLLPAGPLREPVSRIRQADLCISNGGQLPGCYRMQLAPGAFVPVADNGKALPVNSFAGQTVHAVTGIGNPERFFETLRSLSLNVIEHPYPDHHDFTAAELQFADDYAVILTHKDAVKCRDFAPPGTYYLTVKAKTGFAFLQALSQRLRHSG